MQRRYSLEDSFKPPCRGMHRILLHHPPSNFFSIPRPRRCLLHRLSKGICRRIAEHTDGVIYKLFGTAGSCRYHRQSARHCFDCADTERLGQGWKDEYRRPSKSLSNLFLIQFPRQFDSSCKIVMCDLLFKRRPGGSLPTNDEPKFLFLSKGSCKCLNKIQMILPVDKTSHCDKGKSPGFSICTGANPPARRGA